MNAKLYPAVTMFVLTTAPMIATWAAESTNGETWQVGTPIVTYYAGPSMTEAVARQMAAGGFNLVWCGEKELDLVHRHRLRGMIRDGRLSPSSLETPEKLAKLDTLIDQVRKHPAMHSYYITDEPNAAAFPDLGKLVAHLRLRDPDHMAYINLFPTYASNAQLGTQGDVVTAYREHLRQYVEIVKPMLISYDHYQFMKAGDTTQYFLNLSMIRQASQEANVPFLNIVQACSWAPSVRVPVPDEMRYLVYTTAAYGAQGISYYVYTAQGHKGGMADADGTPTPIYDALTSLNKEFVALVTELQPLRSQAVYHTTMAEAGCIPLPSDAVFGLDESPPGYEGRGMMLGYFGEGEKPSHVVVVNLDYKSAVSTTLSGPGNLEVFDAATRKWSSPRTSRVEIRLPPGGGKLVRCRQ